MGQSPIDGRGLTIENVFSGKRYRLEQFQRDYSWGREEIRQLLEDLHRRFGKNYQADHEREQVASYEPYFLGSFVYHEQDAITYVVDGQQRITTVHMLLLYVGRLLGQMDMVDDARTLHSLVKTSAYGRSTYVVDIPERSAVLDRLFDDEQELPSDATAEQRRLWTAGDEIDTVFPDELRGEALPYFADWLLRRVCMVGIQAASKEQASEIYESVNDRGVRLGPLDLFKSQLMRDVPGETSGMDKAWRELISQLAALDANAPAQFVRAYLTGRYAETMADAERIEENFYAWFRDNKARIGLVKKGDCLRLLGEMKQYAERYATFARASESYDQVGQLRHFFFNRYNRLPDQFSPVMAAVEPGDDPAKAKQKAAFVARYLDLLYVWRLVSGQSTSEPELLEAAREITLALRPAISVTDVQTVLADHVRRLDYGFVGMDTFGLHGTPRRQVRYILARLTAFVEHGANRPDLCAEYLSETEPHEIEHIWANHFERYQSGEVKNRQAFDSLRNRLGALLLLPKSDNASYRDDPYERKVEHYRGQNWLAASLHPTSHSRNPQFLSFVKRYKLESGFRPFTSFDAKAILVRQKLYRQLCERIWNVEEMFGVKPTHFAEVRDPAAARTRAHYDVRVRGLIDAGALKIGEKLTASRRDETFTATIRDDGRLELPTGEVYASLSKAGQVVTGNKSCPGWEFWRVQRAGRSVKLQEIRKAALIAGDLPAQQLLLSSAREEL